MSHNTLLLSTITFEELPPLHIEHHTHQSLLPSSIEEDEDDPRSLLYLFEDNDFERAAAFLAIEEARQRAQAAAEALVEAEVREQRTRALANRLRQLLEEDDELVDMLGRRILATQGYQVNDLWQPHYHHRNSPQYYPYPEYGPQHASTSRAIHPRLDTVHQARFPDVHAAWDGFADQPSLSDYARASPFIHAAPVILQGHAPYQPKATRRVAVQSRPTAGPSQSSARSPAAARLTIHPLTGVPMLLVEDSTADVPISNRDAQALDHAYESDNDADEWAIDDESDLDWLGRELLRRQGGANVWVLGTDDDIPSQSSTKESSSAQSHPTTTSSSAAEQLAKQATSATPTLPVEVEEVDSDHELANVASALDPSGRESGASLSSPSQRVAAALARAALLSPKPASKSSSASGKQRRQRAATVMSESEEEELETVGRPVVESDEEREVGEGDENSLNDRPRKSVKVVDLR